MSSKLHPYAARAPLDLRGRSIPLPCGVVLQKAKPTFQQWDVEVHGIPALPLLHVLRTPHGIPELSSQIICSRCLIAAEAVGLRWWYGLMEGQERHDVEFHTSGYFQEV